MEIFFCKNFSIAIRRIFVTIYIYFFYHKSDNSCIYLHTGLSINRIVLIDLKFSSSKYITLSDAAIFYIIKRAAARRDSGNTVNAFSESIEIRRMWLDFMHDQSRAFQQLIHRNTPMNRLESIYCCTSGTVMIVSMNY